jgi:prepilin-type N-terminal cleavage/methylation domain-containing protein
MRLKNHKGFTLVEIAIVVVIVGVILTIIPLRLQSLRTHTDLSLVMQQREDLWQRSVTKMRQ